MSSAITRDYKITFNGFPTIKELKRELDYAEKVYGEWRQVEVETNGSSDHELVEVYFYLTGSTA